MFDEPRDQIHRGEILKWGLFAGFLEGLFIATASILYLKHPWVVLANTWELRVSMLLMAFVVLGGIVTTVVVFAHPIYCLIRHHYRDALLTVLVSAATIVAMTGFVIWSSPWLINTY